MENIQSQEKAPLPKVEFGQAPADGQAKLLLDLFTNGTRWKAMILKFFPELANVLKETSNKDENLNACKTLVQEKIDSSKHKLIESQESIQKEWDLINDKFLTILSDHFGTDWPEDKKTMKGFVSVVPICPRFLDNYSFYVRYGNTQEAIAIAAHEIVHFLWFKKWKEVFPETPRNEYEAPHLVWRLSEIMDPIILQCQPKIKELIKPKGWGYTSFEKIKIGEIGMTEHFKNLYLKCVDEGKSFEDILRITYSEAQKYEKEISEF